MITMDINGSEEDGDGQVYSDLAQKSVCRDYLRNVCHRGRRCKFLHPTPVDLASLVDVSADATAYEFCHDFQNNQCQRPNCRFMHCTKEEEEIYVATKKLPLKLKLQSDFGISDLAVLGNEKQLHDKDTRQTDARGPVCRDYLNRECYRGKKCKFVHPDFMQTALIAPDSDIVAGIKRPRMHSKMEKYDEDCKDYPTFTSSQDVNVCNLSNEQLEEENQTLKKRIQELEKQVSDLAATNEVLLEQNAQFRLQKRGITSYKLSSEPLTTTFTPGLNTPANLPANVVANNAPRPVPVQLNVQVASQPPTQDMMNAAPGQPPRGTVVTAGGRLQQVPVSVSQTTDIASRDPVGGHDLYFEEPYFEALDCKAAQVMAANIVANSVANVETLQGTNRIVPALSGPMQHSNTLIGQPNLNRMSQQPIAASFAAPVPNHNQLGQQQQPMGSFAGAMPTHNQMTQPLGSFAGTVVAAAIGGGGPIQAPNNNLRVSVAADVRQPSVGSLGHAVQLPPPAVVYTFTRSTENMSMASAMVTATGHEITLVGDAQRNPVCSMPGSMHAVGHPVQAFNTVSPGNQAMVQASSHQNTGMPCSPLTSGIAAANTSMPPSVSLGAVRPVVQNNLGGSPQVNAGQRTVVQPPNQMNEAALITYPIAPVPPTAMHN